MLAVCPAVEWVAWAEWVAWVEWAAWTSKSRQRGVVPWHDVAHDFQKQSRRGKPWRLSYVPECDMGARAAARGRWSLAGRGESHSDRAENVNRSLEQKSSAQSQRNSDST
jgi:hypothetical protein